MNFIKAVREADRGRRIRVPKGECGSDHAFLVSDGFWLVWEGSSEPFIPSTSVVLSEEWEVEE